MSTSMSAPENNALEMNASSALDDPEQVVVVYDVVESWTRGQAHELVTDLDTAIIALAITDALSDMGYRTESKPIHTLDELVNSLSEFDPKSTLIFNMCEALGSTPHGASEVTSKLEELNFCFVGADSGNLSACLDKSNTKAHLLQHCIPTAPYQIFVTGQEPISVPLPAIVKPVYEDCSVGLNENSVVCTSEALRHQVSYILDTYCQPALVEWFLTGREFTISLWDESTTKILAISEVDYSDTKDPLRAFYAFDDKWGEKGYPTVCPAKLDIGMETDIRHYALKAYQVMGCRDYARIDMREKDGNVYVLEVNPNPSLAPIADFEKAAVVAGYSYTQMAQHLVHIAWHRSKLHHFIDQSFCNPPF